MLDGKGLFDRQRMENREMTGIAYQQETLFGDDVREYLLEKWKSAYCGARDVQREIDPILAKSLGGTVRVSPLVICCQSCHQKKGKLTLCLFLKDPGKVDQILCSSKKTLNRSRKVVGEALVSLGKKRIFGVEPRQNAIE